MSGRHEQNLIGPRLRELRMRLQCSRQSLAARLSGMGYRKGTRSWVSMVEIQKVAVTDFHLLLLAKALSVPLSELLEPLAAHAAEKGGD